MRRTIAVLLVLAVGTSSSWAAKRVTAAQFEEAVAAFHGKSDRETAFLVADMQLTERLSEARLARLKTMLLGERSSEALTAVADASEFQAPPPNELPSTALPDLAAQRRIMGLTAEYVSKTVPKLPNFIATRVTTFFEDTPLVIEPKESIHYQPLHRVGNSSVTVLYREGREVVESQTKHTPSATMPKGLESWGEFGPILATILVDAAQNTIAFSRWESGLAGLVAVFRYSVPQARSHYDVNYCCIADEGSTFPFHQVVGYHGEMTVDPERGSILRLSAVAELKAGSPVTRADILVDYGPVTIAGQTYLCPVKSVSITTAQIVQLDPVLGYPLARQMQPLKTMLNHVMFDQYHVFRSESRVLTAENGVGSDATGSELEEAAQASPLDTGAPNRAKTSDRQNPNATTGGAETRVHAGAPTSENSATASLTPIAPIRAEPERPEITFSDAGDIPGAAAQSQPAAASSGFRLRTTTRLVDVGMVVYDKKGRPVTDLKQGDFEIYDNGRRQQIKYFGQLSKSAAPAFSPPLNAEPAGVPLQPLFSNRRTGSLLQTRTTTVEMHATILLIDASNLAWNDIQYARREMQRFLRGLAPGEPVGLYILGSYGFQVLLESTPDHDRVVAELGRWMPSAQDLARAQDEEKRNRQHFDWVIRSSDLAYVNGNDGTDPEQNSSGTQRTMSLANPVDPQVRRMGSNPQRDVLLNLQLVARHLAAIPGHKSLVWISSDNALADWRSQTSTTPEDKGSNFSDPLAVRTRETLNESHVSIYPLNASELEAGVITADLENRVVKARRPPLPGEPPPPPPDPTGRYAAQMHQDTHAIQPEFRELAEATGGRALRRAGDIANELNSIAEDGRAAYMLSFTPDVPADDKYHLITVRLAAGAI